jgi:predicted Zn-dependent protease
VKSSGLSPTEEASIAGVKVAGKKASSTSTDGSGVTQAVKHALNLFDSSSSASKDKAAPPEPPQKRPRKSPPTKDTPKPTTVKGIFE